MKNNLIKKVLMVTRTFPPGCGVAVQRPMKFTKFLPEYGWKPYVLTPKKYIEPLDYTIMSNVPSEAKVYEVGSVDKFTLEGKLRKKKEKGDIGEIVYTIFRMALWIYGLIYSRIVIIDWHEGWVPFGVFRGWKIIKKENINLIFVDMEPPSTSLIGIVLKKITGKPMLIDYHDPWTTSIYSKRSKGIRSRAAELIEHKILKMADKITAGKDIIIDEILEKFPDLDKKKFYTIYSGYDPDDYTGMVKKRNEKFRITYTGKISEKFYYSPESFLRALSILIREKKIPEDEVEVIFAGTLSKNYRNRFFSIVKELFLDNIVISTGYVDHKTCSIYQINSDVLLYILESLEGKKISYEFSGALPSKLYEYFYTRNPILAIVPPGIEADLVERTKTGLVAEPNEVQSVKKALYKLYKGFRNGKRITEPDRQEVGRFHRKRLTGELAEVFEGMIGEDNTGA